jgi:hypothetical protein
MNLRDLGVTAARAGNLQSKIILKTKDSKSSQAMDSIETGDNDSQPARRRGPGRPPKDGIMSKRERAELAREQKLLPSARPTEVSHHLHSKCPRPGRQLPKNLLFLSHQQTNHPRSGSTPRERSRMAHQWILPFPQRKAARCLWSPRKNMSSPHRSKSANRHGHHLPTILRSLLTMPRIWQNRRTTTPFSSLML